MDGIIDELNQNMKYQKHLGRLWLPILLTVLGLFCPLSLLATEDCELRVAKDIERLKTGSGVIQQPMALDSAQAYKLPPDRFQGALILKFKESFLLRFSSSTAKEWLQVSFPNRTELTARLNCQSLRAIKAWGQHERNLAQSALAWVSGASSNSSLGETIIQLEHHHLWAKSLGTKALPPLMAQYQKMLEQVKAIKSKSASQEALFASWKSLKEIIYSNEKSDINYCFDRPLMLSAFDENCANCQGFTGLFLALFLDAGMTEPQGWKLAVEVFTDHIRPVLFHSENDQVFDLTDGRLEERRSSIYDWKLYLYSMIKGSSLSLTDQDERILDQVDTKPIEMSFLCWIRPVNTGSFEYQMLSVEYLKGCERFQDELPPEEPTDLEALINKSLTGNAHGDTSKSEEGASKEGGLLDSLAKLFNRVQTEEAKPSEEPARNLGGRDFKDSVQGFLNLYLFLMGDYCGTACRNELRAGVSPNIEKLRGLIGDIDLAAVAALRDEVAGSGENLELRFSKPTLWERMGFVRELGPTAQDIYRASDERAACFWLKPISLGYDYKMNLPYVYRDNQLFMNDQRLFDRIKGLETIDRYLAIGEALRAAIDQSRSLVEEVFRGSLDDMILAQHLNAARLKKLIHNVQTYEQYLNSVFSGCLSTKDEEELVRDIFKLDEYNQVLVPIADFRARISEEPMEFLASMMDVLDAHPEIKKLELLFGNGSWEALSAYPDKTSRWKDSTYYSGVISYLLENPDYFYVPPGETSKPVVDFDQVVEQQRQSRHVKGLSGGAALPKLAMAPCAEGESGYVQRGLFYIFCEPSSEKIKDASELIASDKDPRPEVVIRERYWPSIFALFDAKDFENHRFILHHLYRPSIADIYSGPRHILDTEVSHPGMRIHLIQTSATNMLLQEGHINKAEALDYMVAYAEESVNMKADGHFENRLRVIAQSEAIHDLKAGWHYLMVSDGSGDEIPGPASWKMINEVQYSPLCIQQRESNLFLVCKFGVSPERLRSVLESYYREFNSMGSGQFILLD